MTTPDHSAGAGPHAGFEDRFSDYYDGLLGETEANEVRAHLETCTACQDAYDEFRGALGALSGLHKMSVADEFNDEVEQTIHRRSGGRFFGRKAFGDRVPFELLALLALALGLAIYVAMRSSDTGSVRPSVHDNEPPKIAPGAREVMPRP